MAHAKALLGFGIALYVGEMAALLLAYNELQLSTLFLMMISPGHHVFFIFSWGITIFPALYGLLMYYLVFRGRVRALLLLPATLLCAAVAQAWDPTNTGFLFVMLSVLVVAIAVHHVILILAGRLSWRWGAPPSDFPFSVKPEAR